jgi:hypothetical protein
MMKKILLASLLLSTVYLAQAQDNASTKKKTDWSKLDLSNRANDHFMIQFGYDGWVNAPDSANPSGFNRHFNMYFMLDKPFKTDPRFSLGFGLGAGSSNIYFKNTIIGMQSNSSTLAFTDVSGSNHYKKYKLTTIFLEAPLEFRYVSDPLNSDRSFKIAVGMKLGYLLNAYTKGKNYQDQTGASIYGTSYKQKDYNKNYFNTTKAAATLRVGYGHFSLDGSYQLTTVLKSSASTGGAINPYSIGLTLSGL